MANVLSHKKCKYPFYLITVMIIKNLLKTIIALALTSSSITLFAQNVELQNRLESHVSILASDSLEGRGVGSETAALAREYILKEFEAVGIAPYKGQFEYTFGIRVQSIRATGTNIVGVIEGNDPNLKNEYIVLGAHYDHVGYEMNDGEKIIYNGADDNASGVASIIEIARKINEQDIQLKRSILFIAFDAEESGLLGSKHFVSDTNLMPKDVKFMFSVDMVGMYSANDGLELSGILSLSEGAELIAAALDEKEVLITKTNANIGQRTDTKPFGDVGVPSAHVFTGLKSPYHKPEDDSDLLDYEGMADVVEFTTVLATQMANSETLTAQPKLESEAEMIAKNKKGIQFGVKANLGSSLHDYVDEFYKSKAGFSGQVGFYSEISIASFLVLQPEVLYGTNGAEHDGGVYRTHAVTVPVNLQLSTPENSGFRFYVFGGGYYSYNFAGSIGSVDLEFKEDIAQENWGLSFGLGAEIMKVTVGYTYKLGLTNLNASTIPGTIEERGSYFTIGRAF